MESVEFIKACKINLSDSLISSDDAYYLEYVTTLEPVDYLSFAKKDIQCENPRGIINALTNCKRTIDCALYNTISWLGYENDGQDNVSLSNYINENLTGITDLQFSLKIASSFKLVPIMIVSNVRKLRNVIEHKFEIPDSIETEGSVEISEMFYKSIENRIHNMTGVEITDIKRYEKTKEGFISGLKISKEDDCVELYFEKKTINVFPNELLYPYLIQLMLEFTDFEVFKKAYQKFVSKIYPEIPLDNIKCSVQPARR